ncbi:MAG: hypothetical protein JWQ90_3725 [Hydrocarboniphaga sp.]|uniref:DUF3617 domain-containing protein n=1 Tax=Hydrocarboniphaga sp. TaxID=2033016 RepID=UPI002617FF22|nr:DUF3617 family protein [Hydrocarboniphaga sp.]MDB5971275.1 hypothetical protein [Hydrocarboniphaga sp.]
MSLSRRLLASGLVCVGLLPVVPARADEFGAMPGLWKTTLQVQSADGAQQPIVEWHCVDEDADPWIDFARLPQTSADTSCKRSAFERSATALQWQMSCAIPGPLNSSGRIVFDAPQHYTGTVTTDGRLLGFPLHSVTSMTGERLAACTSPKD